MNLIGETGTLEINGNKFQSLLKGTKGLNHHIIIAKFYNPSCPHCRNFKPIFDTAAIEAEHHKQNIVFLAIDVAKYPEAGQRLGVRMIPEVRVHFLFSQSHVLL